ncbi:hypothetical protein [Methanobrevibacter sp.]
MFHGSICLFHVVGIGSVFSLSLFNILFLLTYKGFAKNAKPFFYIF